MIVFPACLVRDRIMQKIRMWSSELGMCDSTPPPPPQSAHHCPLPFGWTIITLAAPPAAFLTLKCSECRDPKFHHISFSVMRLGQEKKYSCLVLFTCNLFKALGDNLCLLDGAQQDVPRLPASDWRQSAMQAWGKARLGNSHNEKAPFHRGHSLFS